MLCLVLTFKSGFDKLSFKRKLMLLIMDINIDLSQIYLKVHKYKSNSNAILLFQAKYMSSLESTSPLNA